MKQQITALVLTTNQASGGSHGPLQPPRKSVVIMHEIPGITPKVAQFADEVVARGFTVVMPDLLGTPGKPPSTPYIMGGMAKLCVAREFAAFALNTTSPVIAWLRALARRLGARSTPTFYVSGRVIEGAVGAEVFEERRRRRHFLFADPELLTNDLTNLGFYR